MLNNEAMGSAEPSSLDSDPIYVLKNILNIKYSILNLYQILKLPVLKDT